MYKWRIGSVLSLFEEGDEEPAFRSVEFQVSERHSDGDAVEESRDVIKQAPNHPTFRRQIKHTRDSAFSQLPLLRHTFVLTMPTMTQFKQLVKMHPHSRKEVGGYNSKRNYI